MPDWCTNRLEIRGPNDCVERFAKIAADRNAALRFSALDPPPPDLPRSIETGAKIRALADPRAADLSSLDLATWRTLRWGTDREPVDVAMTRGDGRVCYDFLTAWGPPASLVSAIAQRFSGLEIHLAYYELNNGIAGQVKASAGSFDEHVSAVGTQFVRAALIGSALYDEVTPNLVGVPDSDTRV